MMLSFLTSPLIAQDSTVVKWKTNVIRINDHQYQIKLTGVISSGFHIYLRDSVEGIDGLKIIYNDASIQSSPFVLKSTSKIIADPIFENKKKQVIENTIELTQDLKVNETNINLTKATIAYDFAKGLEYLQEEQALNIKLDENAKETTKVRLHIASIDIENPLNDCGRISSSTNKNRSKSLWNLFFIGFLGGLVALLTPCVFPMIPLTVSFFTKKASSKKAGIKNAFLYGFFIFFIYVLLSLPFHFLDSINPEFLNNISTNVYLNVIFFVVFIFFAFSFFGFYEITLPASFSTGVDSKAGVGNVLGIFFMALTLALVSFSCTGPILGSLLAGSLASDGGAMQLTAGMGGFGLALALPFALFAMFPNWLQSLPKSGGWLNTVKITLGFLELALAFKFLSNADLVKHWGLLKREIFIGIWIIIGALLSLYLFGKLKFSHDTTTVKLSISRKILATVFALLSLYLIPGVTNSSYANLKLISGFPPPLYYSIYQKDSHCVLGLNCAKDYEQALAIAKEEKKPILIDFTGYACVNCRRMEENVWSDPEVYKIMKEKFIIVSLYVDDKKLLPANQQFQFKTKDGLNKDINTVGDQWATFQTENFASNSQPMYAIVNTEEKLLNSPVGYTDKNEYIKWLNCAISTYKNK
jgi:thiol:disulfide interchange protein DsbD